MKHRLIREGRIRDECSVCGWDVKFPGAEFSSCELDHIDGDHNNWTRLNLRMLCPSCHSQTETYKGRNKNRYKKCKLSFWGIVHEIRRISRIVKKQFMFWANIIFWFAIIILIIKTCLNS